MKIMEKNESKTYGITAVEVLSIAFIVLKLCGVIKWSWWWVLSPIWISVIILVVVVATIVLINKR